MARRKPSQDEWREAHHDEAAIFLREGLIAAIKPHLDLVGHDGHLTAGEIRDELLSLYTALPAMVAAGEGE